MATEQAGLRTFAEMENALTAGNTITPAGATTLVGGGNSTQHFHDTDRARANHTGTQTASTISDFQTQVSANTDVSASKTKTDFITVTQAVDLDTIESDTADNNAFRATPSTEITAGTNLSWSGNTLNATGGGSGGGPIATIEWTTNPEIVVDSVDTGTDTFTRTAHGLINGDEIFFITNDDSVGYAIDNIYPSGISEGRYYIVNSTANTFQVSTSVGGAAVSLTSTGVVADFHLEQNVSKSTFELEITGLPSATEYRALFSGRLGRGGVIRVMPNEFLNDSNWYRYGSIGDARIWSGSSIVDGSVYCRIEAVAKITDILWLSHDLNGASWTGATTISNDTERNTKVRPNSASETGITSFKFSGSVLANGSKLEVYAI